MFAALLPQAVDPIELERRLDLQGLAAKHAASGGALLLHAAPKHLPAPSPPRLEADLLIGGTVRIGDRAALAKSLGLTAETTARMPAPALVAAAYRHWAEDCARHLVGDYSFALWDGTRKRLFAARDPLGMHSLYFARRANAWALADSVEVLFALLHEAPRPDALSLAAWLAGKPLPDRGMFSNIEVLPPGCTLLIDEGAARVRRFWDLDSTATLRYRSVDDYATHLRELLGHCVADRLPRTNETVACQLSGGMDSTSVTALAAEHINDRGERLIAVSHLYQPQNACDESALIDETARHLGLRRHLLLPVDQYADMPYEALYPPLLDSPGTVLSPRYIDELERVKDQGARVLLTGSGGDEMTWGHALAYARRLWRGDLSVVGEVIRGTRDHDLPLGQTLWTLFFRPLVPEALRRLRARRRGALPWPDWVPRDKAVEIGLADALRDAVEKRFRNPVLQTRYAALVTSSTYHSIRSYAAAGDRVGVSVRHPFFDRRLAEFSFAIPDDLWLREGYPKWLLRRAMSGRLPDAVTWNRKKIVFDRFFANLIKARYDEVRRLLEHPGLQDLGLLDNKRLLAAFDAAINRDPPTVSVDMLHALMTQVWFQRYADRFGFT